MSTEADTARKSIGAKRSLESAEAILEAAEAVLIENGYSGFSIEAVARRARAGKPTIYRWWPSKTALLLEVYQRQKRDIAYSDTGNIEEDLFIFAKSLFAQWRETPAGNIFRSLVAEAQQDPAAAEALATYSAGRRAHTGKLIERAKARGEVAADVDPSQVADMVSSYAWVHLLTGRLDEDEAILRQAIRHIVHGIAVRR
ncbi:TetR/AcrR family transcriptional regulator [Aminobacter aminovorans]|uniref:TetR/AcrR family transcriptional regulator n=1 Tax=Aminobacter aminovorans TaxID=83263 RepID=UPI00285831FD|nr:TetR/AcrR family transcriptional regulator [Aminobacter aminovorans]MDR7224815.1 AcrR family transcriptional regulator [Aminobacter aminovorans]